MKKRKQKSKKNIIIIGITVVLILGFYLYTQGYFRGTFIQPYKVGDCRCNWGSTSDGPIGSHDIEMIERYSYTPDNPGEDYYWDTEICGSGNWLYRPKCVQLDSDVCICGQNP